MGSDEMGERGPYDVEGHAFAGWEPVNGISDDDREVLAILSKERFPDRSVQAAIDARMQQIEGDLRPTCACGWHGHAEDWVPFSARRDASHQFISHKSNAQMSRALNEHGARVAASALDHVAAAWDGNIVFAEWLRAQAAHLRAAKLYDGEHWPQA